MTGLMIFTKVVKVAESLLKPINNASSESFLILLSMTTTPNHNLLECRLVDFSSVNILHL